MSLSCTHAYLHKGAVFLTSIYVLCPLAYLHYLYRYLFGFQMLLGLVGILGLFILMPSAEASTYTNCLQGCGACVDFFGKDLYDGHKCAMTCKASGVSHYLKQLGSTIPGISIAYGCYP